MIVYLQTIGEILVAGVRASRESACVIRSIAEILMVIAAMKSKRFIGCNMRSRLQPLIPAQGQGLGMQSDKAGYIFWFRNPQ